MSDHYSIAQWLIEQCFCDNIVFATPMGIFIFEENTLWKKYTKEEFSNHFYINVLESLIQKFLSDPNDKTMLENITKLQITSFRKGVLSELLRSKHDPSFPRKLDVQNHLLPVLFNKVVDLKTGEVRPRTKEDFFTKVCNIVWNPQANSDFILDFLQKITCGDKDLLNLLRRTFKSLLTGDEVQGLYIVGHGYNGKSCLIHLFASILGPFAIKNTSDK